jgi:hypothetical protein
MFQADVLDWKCCAPHPFWEGGRGYALRYKGELAAFGCLVPCRFLTGAATVTSCCVIDWAATKTVPGAGVMLYREIQQLTGAMINIGGTEDARAVLPRMGFRAAQQVDIYTRVLRPWQHFHQTPTRDWKSPLRLARDYRELARPARTTSLTLRRLDRFDHSHAALMPDPAVTGAVVCARTPELLNYCLACPAAKMEAWLFERDRAPIGYCLLSRVGRQCRIADLWIRSSDQRAWSEAYAAATTAARSAPQTTEVQVAASLPRQTAAVRQAGYRLTNLEPLFVLDPRAALAGRTDLAISLLENDAWYWTAGP